MGNLQGTQQSIVVLLHDVRHAQLVPGEVVCGWARVRRADGQSDRVLLTKEQPGKLAVCLEDAVSLELFAAPSPTALEAAAREGPRRDGQLLGRPLGVIEMPLRRVIALCGGPCLYHSWLLLSPQEDRDEGRFDSALYSAASEMDRSKVCVSMYLAVEYNGAPIYSTEATVEQKLARYHSLLLSHTQHLHLCQSLYVERVAGPAVRELESKLEKKKQRITFMQQTVDCQRSEIQNLQQVVSELQAKHMELYDSQASRHTAVQSRLEKELAKVQDNHTDAARALAQASQLDTTNALQRDELTRLRVELKQVTEEANARIDQGNEAIRKLKQANRELEEQVDASHRREASARSQAQQASSARQQELEAENIELRDKNAFVTKELSSLAEQKTALMQVVQDLYNQISASEGKLSLGTAAGPASGDASVPQKMLPSPRSMAQQGGMR